MLTRSPSRAHAATPRRVGTAVAAGAVALAIGLGIVLRLVDPMSSPVVPAEDPYNHMALVREHLRTGDLGALNPNENPYPPGLHAFLAAAWAYTGIELYDIILFGPVAFGAIGILGMALLLWRTSGPVAAFVGALALAVAPEAIFRTNMMSPTALDLALLPFFLYALVRTLAGRLGWAGVAAPMAVFLAFAHPWLLAILCAAGFLFLVSLIVLPWPASRGEPVSLLGAAAAVAVLGTGLAVALLRPGFAGTLKLPDLGDPLPLAAGVALLALTPLAVLAWGLRRRWPIVGWRGFKLPPVLVRLALSVGVAVAILGSYAIATKQGMPMHVDLPHMFGWPILALAGLALVAMPFASSPVANLAAALAAVTYPFTVFNPLDSEFLSHRTAAFLGLALAMLVGVAAGALVRAAASALPTPAPPQGAARPVARPLALAAAPALLVTALLGGSVYAGTPDGYPGGWYRLYHPCELDALRDVAAMADAVPSAVVVTGDWQSKLVLAALTSDASRVWFTSELFTSEEKRANLVAQMEREGRPLLVVLDRHLWTVTPDADVGFLSSAPWHPAGSWCANMGVEQPRVTAFATAGVPA